MSIAGNIESFNQSLAGKHCKLIAVSKTKPCSAIKEAYDTGFRRFGENRVQELVEKYQSLPRDIEWHMIGHLQTNKVKLIAPFVALIHAVDSLRLAAEIDKQAAKNHRTIDCLLQVHIALEENKFGFDGVELVQLIEGGKFDEFQNIRFKGLMGMATNTGEKHQVQTEFKELKKLYERIVALPPRNNFDFQELSMGMSSDYQIALEEGSTMIRVGSSIFGERK